MSNTGTGQAFTALIHEALRAYCSDDELARLTPLAELAAVRDQGCACPGLHPGAAVRAVLKAALDELAVVDRAGAELLTRRYVRREPVAEIARGANYSESYLYKKQREALVGLAHLVWQAEEAARSHTLTEAQARALADLPSPTYSRLFGVDTLLARLRGYLAREDAHWLTAIDGLGGMGKTALAHDAVRELLRAGRFARVIWLTARQQFFAWRGIQEETTAVMTYPQLLSELWRSLGLGAFPAPNECGIERRVREALACQPTVLVMDNLETAADIQALTAGLDRLARPTKVLLTTRHRVSAYEGVTSVTANELPMADALAFMHYHASERNVPAAFAASPTEQQRIVAITGGSPLAIKLVVGQMVARPLAVVLADLAEVRAGAHDFYRFIFRHSWLHLSPHAQRLLLHMPLLDARGTSWEELAAVSGCPVDEDFWRAVDELVVCSLLNAGATTGGRIVYSVHQLTEHFLLSDLVHLT